MKDSKGKYLVLLQEYLDWGQVLGYDMSDPVKLSKIDALYISNKNIYLDFKILIATFFKPLRKSLMLRFKDQIKNIEDNFEHV